MPIDWFTVAAQAINFLILVALLRHFLYGPIVRAMDEREQRIAARLEDADRERQEADEERQQLEQNRSELRDRREEILSDAREQAEQQRQETMREAGKEAQRRREAWDRELAEHGEDVVEALLELMGDRLMGGLRTGFAELTGADVQAAAVSRFAGELHALDGESRTELEDAFADGGISVHVARDPSDEEREEILEALDELGSDRERVKFEVDDELLGGVEVRAGGRRVAWSLRRFLEDADEAMQSFIQETRQSSMEESESESESESSGAAADDGEERQDGEHGQHGEAPDRDEDAGRDGDDHARSRGSEHHHAG